jgi:thymidine kinase
MVIRLELIIGPMFSGKTTELIRRVNRYKSINRKCLVINHSNDTRSKDEVLLSHDKTTIRCLKLNTLSNLKNTSEFRDANVIAIDEAQFFTGLREFILEIERTNKIIICSGLDGDFLRNPFEIINCIPLADTVDKLSSLCPDGTPAIFSKRIIEGDTTILVGGKESYIPVSRELYLES